MAAVVVAVATVAVVATAEAVVAAEVEVVGKRAINRCETRESINRQTPRHISAF